MVNTYEPNAVPDLPVAVLRSVRRLTNRRGRDLAGTFLVEGRQAVREALAFGGIVADVIVGDPDKHADLLEGIDCPVWVATDEQMRQLSDTVTPQGVVAVCRQLGHPLESITDARLVVICAQVRDPGNAGTVIRCADAFGADAVILTQGSVELHNPKTVRSTVGSMFHLPIVTGIPLAEAVEYCRANGLQVLAADSDGVALDLLAADGGLSGPTAWIMGNEAWGLPAEDAELADRVVSVPMWGSAESLNLSSAAAICLYQSASAQRRTTERPSTNREDPDVRSA
ncbi:TrmH family RNA methyltransferase [Tessaracoccus antarcticus]|uniref:RNA methyltransferase n=1 Tax=Tessaracoccus antarcticus TaxID=2479848 RepID=A0A3M0GKA3_9ACTN|nr:RNA methyltransferase [Tessaracoccus antarcticus]RMB57746.1 RNA methyltransferase [Tessaracoccus antarcticus]